VCVVCGIVCLIEKKKVNERESVCVVVSCMLLLERGAGVCVCDLSTQALKNVCVTSLDVLPL